VGEEPIVAVMADHGELFGEHSLFGHSNTLYDPLIRVPLVLAGKDLPAGHVVRESVSLADIMPTLLGMAGIQSPAADGIDLRPILTGATSPDARRVLAEQFRPSNEHGWRRQRPEEAESLFARKQAAIAASRKRVVSQDGSDVGYDLRSDPREEHPFPGRETELAARVPQLDPGAQPVAMDAVPRKMLEVLGYLQ
jgi:arylsulfatase A-like enzyme